YWLATCDASYKSCRNSSVWFQRFPPTQLIDLDTELSITLRLCHSRDLPVTTLYTTLSHCWGELKLHTLTTANYHAVQQRGIQVSILTKPFCEAMEVSLRLEAHYIWMDSLCIVPD
ncbi:hypothetical protein K432DRAFT_302277, partial [Lepidopterella palustris CBS 459.81]